MKKTHLLLFNLCLPIIFLTGKISGQRNDAVLWTSIELKKQIVPNLFFHYQQAARIGQNITRFNYSYSDFGASYKFNKYIQTSIDYRFINKRLISQEFSFRHRIYWTLTLKKKIKPLIFVYRQRLQYQLEDINTSENGKQGIYYTRSKIKIKYALYQFTPYIAMELFTKINQWQDLKSDKYRLFAGCSYKFNKTNELDVYYLFDRAFNQPNPLTNYVVGIGFSHTFY